MRLAPVRALVLLLVALTAAALLHGCPEPSGEARAYYGAKRPGDVVEVEIDGSSVTLENTTIGQTLTGTITGALAGFEVLDWTDSDGNAGTAWFVEIGDQGLLGLESYIEQVVVASARGACPTADATYNVLWTPDCEWEPTTDSAFAVLTFTAESDGTWTIAGPSYTLAGTQAETLSFPGATCADGVFSIPGEAVTVGVTTEGLLVLDGGPDAGAGAGFPVPTTAPTAADIQAVATYRGFLSKSIPDTETGVGPVASIPVEARGDAAGLHGYSIDLAGSGAADGPYEFTFDPTLYPALPGVLGGTFIDQSFVFLTAEVNGLRFLYGMTFDNASITFDPDATEGFFVYPGRTVCECLSDPSLCPHEENPDFTDDPVHPDDDGETAIPGYNLSSLVMFLGEK